MGARLRPTRMLPGAVASPQTNSQNSAQAKADPAAIRQDSPGIRAGGEMDQASTKDPLAAHRRRALVTRLPWSWPAPVADRLQAPQRETQHRSAGCWMLPPARRTLAGAGLPAAPTPPAA